MPPKILTLPQAPLPAGHREQIGQLYSEHHSWLYGWLCRKLGCSHRAADVAQDTFLRLFSLPASTRLREPRGFLTTTATRLVIDAARRKQIEQQYLDNYYYYHGQEAVAPSAEQLTIISETLAAIAKMLDALPEKCQKAFLMSRLDGMRHSEIASTLGVSKSRVKQYMAKAMLHCYQLSYIPEYKADDCIL
ncbi:MAG: sigma-70 family RNA polymerase sigma factor [Pseudomonadales bacterium]|nr:sigma-70 family RNA polymerase sigma factor [Pseudomonadales bacterium]